MRALLALILFEQHTARTRSGTRAGEKPLIAQDQRRPKKRPADRLGGYDAATDTLSQAHDDLAGTTPRTFPTPCRSSNSAGSAKFVSGCPCGRFRQLPSGMFGRPRELGEPGRDSLNTARRRERSLAAAISRSSGEAADP